MPSSMDGLLTTILTEGYEFSFEANWGAVLEAEARVGEMLRNESDKERLQAWEDLLRSVGSEGGREAATLLTLAVLPNVSWCPEPLSSRLGHTMASFCRRKCDGTASTQRQLLAEFHDTVGLDATQEILHAWSTDARAQIREASAVLFGKLYHKLPQQADALADLRRLTSDPAESECDGHPVSKQADRSLAWIELDGSSEVERPARAQPDRRRIQIFVAHAFSRNGCDDLRDAVGAAAEGTSVSPLYADDEVVDGHILMHKIFPIIDRSRFGLYEISETNRPNVFLELGYAKGRGKPCYLLLRQGERPPSNLAGCDRVDYESYRHLTEKLRGLFEVWCSHRFPPG